MLLFYVRHGEPTCDPDELTCLDMPHTALTVIELKEDADGLVIPRAVTMSSDGHLYKEGVPMNNDNGKF